MSDQERVKTENRGPIEFQLTYPKTISKQVRKSKQIRHSLLQYLPCLIDLHDLPVNPACQC